MSSDAALSSPVNTLIANSAEVFRQLGIIPGTFVINEISLIKYTTPSNTTPTYFFSYSFTLRIGRPGTASTLGRFQGPPGPPGPVAPPPPPGGGGDLFQVLTNGNTTGPDAYTLGKDIVISTGNAIKTLGGQFPGSSGVNLLVQSGNGNGTAAGGIINFVAGTGGTIGGTGGGISFQAGAAINGTGGNASISAGASGVGATGNGGSVIVNGGNSASTNGNGGSIIFNPGSKTGTGTNGVVLINGKLTVTGLIDPTGLVLDKQASSPFTPPTNKGTVWVKNTSPTKLFFTDSSGVDWDVLSGSASSLTSVLAIGNTTGVDAYTPGSNIIISDGDTISTAVGQNPGDSGINLVIQGGTGNGAGGGNTNITAGSADTGFTGGTIFVTGGDSINGVGGPAILRGGDPNGGGTSTPGQITAYGGNDSSNIGGDIEIFAGIGKGPGPTDGNGASVTITGGDANNGIDLGSKIRVIGGESASPYSRGGRVEIIGGDQGILGVGSRVNVWGGGGGTFSGAGGNIDILAGDSSATGGAAFGGGIINIVAGDTFNDDYGGPINITTGAADPLSAAATGGDLTIITGNGGGTGTGRGGNFTVFTGIGEFGGDITLQTDSAVSGGTKGGNISLIAGGGGGTGVGGDIILELTDQSIAFGTIDFRTSSGGSSFINHDPEGVTNTFLAPGFPATVVEYGSAPTGIVEIRQKDQSTVGGISAFFIHAANSTDDAGGTIALTGGTAAPGFSGGSIDLLAAPGNGAVNGGSIAIHSGTSGAGATGDGGTIGIAANNAISTNGTGGLLGLQTGSGTGTGDGGQFIVITGDSGGGATGDGGAITVTAGAATSTAGNGGSITLKPGVTVGGAVGLINLQDSAGANKIQINSTGIGFFAVTPAAQPTYTVTFPVTDRSFDTTTITLQNLAEVVGTIIADLQTYGLFL